MKLPVGVKMQAREPREGLTRSSSLGFCQGTGRDQNNCALVGNSTHPSITCSLQWRPTKRLHKVRAPYIRGHKDNKDFPSAKHCLGKEESEGRERKKEEV